MTLQWKKGRNPYVHNPHGFLQLGPFAKPNEIIPQEKKLRTKLKRSREALTLAGVALGEHDLGEASKQLRDPASLARALLLVHPQNRLNVRRRKQLTGEIRDENNERTLVDTLKFRRPAGLCWFAPSPRESLVLADWREFAADLEPRGAMERLLDIEYDR